MVVFLLTDLFGHRRGRILGDAAFFLNPFSQPFVTSAYFTIDPRRWKSARTKALVVCGAAIARQPYGQQQMQRALPPRRIGRVVDRHDVIDAGAPDLGPDQIVLHLDRQLHWLNRYRL
jgi:hypothetical protein